MTRLSVIVADSSLQSLGPRMHCKVVFTAEISASRTPCRPVGRREGASDKTGVRGPGGAQSLNSTAAAHHQPHHHEAGHVPPRAPAGRLVPGSCVAAAARRRAAAGAAGHARRRRRQPPVPQPVAQLRQLRRRQRVRVRRHGLPPHLQRGLPRRQALLLRRPVPEDDALGGLRQHAARHHRLHLHRRAGGAGLLPRALLLQHVLRVLQGRGLRVQLPDRPGVRPGERQLRAPGQEPRQLQQLQLRGQRQQVPAVRAGPVRVRVLRVRHQGPGQQVPDQLPHEPLQRLGALQALLLQRGPHRGRRQRQRLLQLPGAGRRPPVGPPQGVLPARHGVQRGRQALRADRSPERHCEPVTDKPINYTLRVRYMMSKSI